MTEGEGIGDRRSTVLVVLALGVIASLTLGPSPPPANPQTEPGAGFFCLLGCGGQSLRDLISNVLLFLPLGWALRLRGSTWRAVGWCLITTTVIEALQATVIAGRDSTLRDILSNTAGGALGAWACISWRSALLSTQRASIALGTTAVMGWATLLLLSGWGVRPAPSRWPWFGQWTPVLGQYVVYPGTVLSVRVGSQTPPDGPIAEPVEARDSLEMGGLITSVRAVSGPEPKGTAPMFAIYDSKRREQLFVGQERSSLILHLGNRFEAWELRGIRVRLTRFPGREAGDTIRVRAGLANRALVLEVEGPAGRDEARLPLTVGLGWSALLPFDFPIWDEWKVMNPLWLAILIAPAAYWWCRAAPLASIGLTASMLVVGLGLMPTLAGAASTTRGEWIGAVLGAASGWIGGLWSRRTPPAAPSARPEA